MGTGLYRKRRESKIATYRMNIFNELKAVKGKDVAVITYLNEKFFRPNIFKEETWRLLKIKL
jgi:hypothetical protein